MLRNRPAQGVILAVALAGCLIGTRRDCLAAPLQLVRPPPINCLDLLPPRASSDTLLDWRDTVAVEHCDRIKRLWNIAQYASDGPPPQFFDGYVGADRLPSAIGVPLPLLRVVFPDRYFFDTDQSVLRPQAQEVVRIIARDLQLEPPDTVLFVAGHADARGSREYNLNLSVERANAVANAILEQGVNVAQVWRVGFGKELPLRAGDNEAAWRQNRRVEFLFAARSEVVAAWMVTEQLALLCQGANADETQACRRQINPPRVIARPVAPIRSGPRPPEAPGPTIVHIPDPEQEHVIVLDPVNGSYDYQRRTP